MDTKQAISNLEQLSDALSRHANLPKNYNTQWAMYLEQMGFEMHRHANILRDIDDQFGINEFNEG